MDLTGTGLFAGSLFALMVGLSGLGTSSERSSWLFSGMLFIAAIILMLLFLRHEARSQNPIIDMQLLRERPFLAANIFNFMYGACAFGIMSLIPLYAVSVYGLSILESGIILTPRSVGLIISSSVTSFSLPRWGYRRPILLGTAIVAVCLFLLGIELQGVNISGIHLSNTVLLVIVMLVAGVGMGTVNPAANNACIELMPQRVATITGVRGMFRQSGGAISIAVASLMLHNITDISHGFTFVFYGLAAVMIISIPLIFAMPKAAQTASPIRK